MSIEITWSKLSSLDVLFPNSRLFLTLDKIVQFHQIYVFQVLVTESSDPVPAVNSQDSCLLSGSPFQSECLLHTEQGNVRNRTHVDPLEISFCSD